MYVALATVYGLGVPIFHAMDRDRTGLRDDRLKDAMLWPLYAIVIAVIGSAWAIGKTLVKLRLVKD